MADEETSSQKLRYAAGDRAYHALLTTQAMYKAYIPATSDSLINIAWDYYKDHGPYDRRIRAMLYKGTTAKELGHPEEAMQWYKQCENSISDEDYYNHGYVLLRMAYLYQFQYIAPKKAIALHKRSYDYFIKCQDLHYQLVCLTELGMIYRLTNLDSAIYFSDKAINLAKQINDSSQLYKNYEAIAGCYVELKDWKKASNYSMTVVHSQWANEYDACYYFAAQSYQHLGLMDSAWAIFNTAPHPITVRDSVLYYRTMADLLYEEERYKESVKYSDTAIDISGKAVISQSKINYSQIEKEFENKLLSENNKDLSLRIRWLWVLLVIIAFSIIVSAYYIYNEYKKYNRQIIIDKEKISDANNEIKLLSEKLENRYLRLTNNTLQDEKYKEIVDIQSSCTKTLFKSTVYSGLRGASIFKYIFDIQKAKNKLLVRIKLPEQFWADLNKYIELSFPNALKNIENEGISLTEKEKKLIFLDCLHVPNAVSAIILDYAEFSTASMRNRLITKLGGNGNTLFQIMNDKSDKLP